MALWHSRQRLKCQIVSILGRAARASGAEEVEGWRKMWGLDREGARGTGLDETSPAAPRLVHNCPGSVASPDRG